MGVTLCVCYSDDPFLSMLHLRADCRDSQLPVCSGAEQTAKLNAIAPPGSHDAGLSG